MTLCNLYPRPCFTHKSKNAFIPVRMHKENPMAQKWQFLSEFKDETVLEHADLTDNTSGSWAVIWDYHRELQWGRLIHWSSWIMICCLFQKGGWKSG